MVLCLLALLSPARAAVRVQVTDAWLESSDAALEARHRANRWSNAIGLRLTQVLSTGQDDRFAETVAVFERFEPLPPNVLEDEELARTRLGELVGEVVGYEGPEAFELRTLPDGGRVAWGRWLVDDLAYECVLAPSGETTSIVMMAVLADELPRHRGRLDRVITQLQGVSEPVADFSPRLWQAISVLLWLVTAVALHMIFLRFADRDGEHREAGQRAALVLVILVVIAGLVTYLLLGQRETDLAQAGTSRGQLVVWLVVWGLIAAAGLLVAAARLDRGIVRSAPTSGVYASGTYSTADMVIRANIRRSSDGQESSDMWGPDEQPAEGSSVRGRIGDDRQRSP